MAFDPDKYLGMTSGNSEFNPDAYLQKDSKDKFAVDFVPTAENLAKGRDEKAIKRQQANNFNIGDIILGAGETALSLGTGLVGGIGGGIQALPAMFSPQNYGTAAGADYAEKVALDAMRGMTYAPRTQAGQRMTEGVAGMLEPLAAIAPMTQFQALSRISNPKVQLPKSELISKASGLSKDASAKVNNAIKPITRAIGEPLRAAKAGLYDPVVNQQDIVSSTIGKSVRRQDIPDIIAGLERKAKTSGVNFSAGQATGNPAFASMEDTLMSINPTGELNLQAMANRRNLAAPIANLAKDEIAIDAAKQVRRDATENMYKALDEVMVTGGDDLNFLLERANASGALAEAKKIANIKNPRKPFAFDVIEETPPARMVESELAAPFEMVSEMPKKIPLEKEPLSLSGHLKKTGGISQDYIMDITGEKSPKQSGATVGLFTKKAEGIDDAVVRAVEGGYLPETILNEVDGGSSALIDLLANEIQMGEKTFPLSYDAYARQMASEYNQTPQSITKQVGAPANAPAPIQERGIIGKAVRGEDLNNLKKGIDQAIRKAEIGSPLYNELINLKNDYMAWQDSTGKGFLDANNKFKELSKPISKMEVSQILKDKFIPATAEDVPSSLKAESLARALKNKDAIARKVAKGANVKLNSIFTKKEMDTILGISSDASRIAETQKLGAGYGSPTARRTAVSNFIGENFKRQAPNVSRFIEILNQVPIAKYVTKGGSTAGGFIGSKINANIAAELERMLASDPQGVANALKKEIGLISDKKIKVDYVNPLMTKEGLLYSSPSTQNNDAFQLNPITVTP